MNSHDAGMRILAGNGPPLRDMPTASMVDPPRTLEAVVVCDEYSDFLEESLPHMRRHVDDLVVVTSKEDKATQALCAKMDTRCLPTWHHRRDGQFDKAKAINHGLAHLKCDGYLIHLDADIILPDMFGEWFKKSKTLQPDKIYGVDRFNVGTKAELQRVYDQGWLHARKSWRYLIHPPGGLQLATRVAHGDYEGWMPIGFFQLWHCSEQLRYSLKGNSNSEHTDLLFGSLWPPEDRILIPDFFVLHLATTGKVGANWSGRTSPRWK